MNIYNITGIIFLLIGGGLLYDVPFPRFILALLFVFIGQLLLEKGLF